jgi:hypothetical protein
VGVTTGRTAIGLRAAAVAGVAALALAACSPDEPGAAALVAGERITTDQVSQAVKGIRQGNPEIAQTEGLDQTVLFYLVVAPFLLPRAEQAGAGVSESEVVTQLLPRAGSDPDPQSVRVLQTFLSLQKLQQAGATPVLEQVQQQIRSAKIRVNPRFGRLDTNQLQIVARQPNWLARTAATPAAGEQTTPATP